MIEKKKNTLMINKNNKNQNWEKQSFKRKNIVYKFKDHAELNYLNSWFIFSETFFSEASSASNNILIINILKKDLTW